MRRLSHRWAGAVVRLLRAAGGRAARLCLLLCCAPLIACASGSNHVDLTPDYHEPADHFAVLHYCHRKQAILPYLIDGKKTYALYPKDRRVYFVRKGCDQKTIRIPAGQACLLFDYRGINQIPFFFEENHDYATLDLNRVEAHPVAAIILMDPSGLVQTFHVGTVIYDNKDVPPGFKYSPTTKDNDLLSKIAKVRFSFTDEDQNFASSQGLSEAFQKKCKFAHHYEYPVTLGGQSRHEYIPTLGWLAYKPVFRRLKR